MKYLKLFEAEIMRSFSDWLKDPKVPARTEFKYNIIFPIRKEWMFIDDGDFTLVDMDEFTKDESGMSLIDVIGKDMDLQRDEVLANEDEVYDAWLDQEWDGLGKYDKFLNTFGLNFKESFITTEDFLHLRRSLSGSHLEKQFDARSFGGTFNVLAIRTKKLSESGDEITLEIQVNKELNDDQKDTIRDFISGQLADDWGRNFSKQVRRENRGNLEFDTRIEVWWNSGYPAWGIEIEESINENRGIQIPLGDVPHRIKVVDDIKHLLTEVGEGDLRLLEIIEDHGGTRLYDHPEIQSGYINVRGFYLASYPDYTPKNVDMDYVLASADRLEDIGVKMICHNLGSIGLTFLLTGLENYNDLKKSGFLFFEDMKWEKSIGDKKYARWTKCVCGNAIITIEEYKNGWDFNFAKVPGSKLLLDFPFQIVFWDRGMAEYNNYLLQSKFGPATYPWR